MVKIAKHGQNCQKWSKIIQNGSKRSKMVQNDPNMVQNGEKWAKWSKLPNMVKIAKNGQMVQNGPNGKERSKMAGLTLSGPDVLA